MALSFRETGKVEGSTVRDRVHCLGGCFVFKKMEIFTAI